MSPLGHREGQQEFLPPADLKFGSSEPIDHRVLSPVTQSWHCTPFSPTDLWGDDGQALPHGGGCREEGVGAPILGTSQSPAPHDLDFSFLRHMSCGRHCPELPTSHNDHAPVRDFLMLLVIGGRGDENPVNGAE